jgi:hypothetical protein
MNAISGRDIEVFQPQMERRTENEKHSTFNTQHRTKPFLECSMLNVER